MALTMENSGAALVAGVPLPRNTSRVRVLRPFLVDGQPAPVGAELTLPKIFAAEMCGANKAVLLPGDAPEAVPAATPPAPRAQKRKDSDHAGQ
jgi:hypothetical protein